MTSPYSDMWLLINLNSLLFITNYYQQFLGNFITKSCSLTFLLIYFANTHNSKRFKGFYPLRGLNCECNQKFKLIQNWRCSQNDWIFNYIFIWIHIYNELCHQNVIGCLSTEAFITRFNFMWSRFFAYHSKLCLFHKRLCL